ncbi:MAG: cyclic nucleotide-binding/CBS domain-containing protein [Fidelibacterota bacterium]
MVNQFDDEIARMDELEQEESPGVHEAVSLNEPLSELNLQTPIILPSGATVKKAVKQLKITSFGCVLIEDQGRLIGILTERDILQKITGRGLNLDQEIVDTFMTPDPEYLKMEDPIVYALNKMYVGGFRHVPLVDDNKNPVGLVSLVDIVHHISDFFSNEVLNLPTKPQRKGFKRPEGG